MSPTLQVAENPLEAALAAVARGDWAQAYSLLSAADRDRTLAARDLEFLAEAAFVTGRPEESLSARERAYSAHVGAGDLQAAAFAAVTLAYWRYRRGEMVIVGGWLKNAERLLQSQPVGPAHVLLAFISTYAALFGPRDLDAAAAHAAEAMEIAARLGRHDLRMLTLTAMADVRAKQGCTDEAVVMIDEAMTGAMTGGLPPWAMCHVICRTLTVCNQIGDYERGNQWADAVKSSLAGHVPLSGECRVHRATLLLARGSWTEAEQEARVGCGELPGDVMHYAMAKYDIGEILLRRGDVHGAEEAFAEANEMGRSPQPGLALLELERGRATRARSMIARALEEEPVDRDRAPLLAAQVDIALALDDLDAARAALVELQLIAEALARTPLFAAMASCAHGAVQLAAGDIPVAVRSLRAGWRAWHQLGDPYRAAQARVCLGRAYLAQGDTDSAELELRGALSVLERLGAASHARRVAELLRGLPDAQEGVDRPRVLKTFMFTDIVSSTSLVEALGDDAWVDVRCWHDATLRSRFSEHRGEEVDHAGDGFFVAFDSARDAVECALSIQRRLGEHRRSAGFAPQLRIGLHSVEATRSAEGYSGHGVHVAARIGALAQGGEILATQTTIETCGLHLPVRDERTVRLTGIAHPLHVATVPWR